MMHERIYTHVLIMLGLATQNIFKQKVAALAKAHGLTGINVQIPEPKAFSRANNKVSRSMNNVLAPCESILLTFNGFNGLHWRDNKVKGPTF